MILRVKDWNTLYETHKTRILKRLDYVMLKNSMGYGYLCLLDHPDGAAHFGTWVALLQIASKCEKRGTLMRSDQPHTVASLSVLSRIPASVIETAVARLASPEVGWLEFVSSDGKVTHMAVSAGSAPESGARIEENRREENIKSISPTASPIGGSPASKPKPPKEPTPQDAWFNQCWSIYWRKEHRSECYRAFCRHVKTTEKAEAIAKAVKSQSYKYMANEVQFRPLFSTWLNKQRYLDTTEDSPQGVSVSKPLTPRVPEVIDEPSEYIKLLESKVKLGFIPPERLELEKLRLGVTALKPQGAR